jgi:hypothetical protein
MQSAARLASIDCFRGFAVLVMVLATFLFGTEVLPAWLRHGPDGSVTVVDLGAPLFIVAIGLTFGVSLQRRWARDGPLRAIWHFLRRALILFAIGLAMALIWTRLGLNESGIYWGVLQTIAVAIVLALPLLRLSPPARLDSLTVNREDNMGTPDWTSRILPRDLNGIVLWTTSFMMLFLLIRRYDTAKHLKVGFWARDAFAETFIHFFIWSLTVATFIYYVFFGGEMVLVRTAEQLPPMPSTFYSIILSVIAFGTFLVTILRYTTRREQKYPAPRNFLICFAILAVFIGMRYAILFLAPPWGDPIHSIVNLVIDTCVFGLLFPYIFAGAILYMISALRAT